MGCSPEAGRRRGDRIMVAKWQLGGCSVEAVLELREERRRVGMDVMETE
jgi:hypothetical protein